MNLELLSTKDYSIAGRALVMNGRPKSGMAFLDEALRREPGNIDDRLTMSTALLKLQRTTEAKEVLRDVVLHNSRNAIAWRILGCAHFMAGEFEEARQAFEAGQRSDPTMQHVFWSALGSCSRFLGDFPRAIEEYRNGFNDNPEDYLSKYSYGMMLLRVGSWLSGFTYYEWRLNLRSVFPVPEHVLPRWDIAGPHSDARKLLVVAEQGIGDVFFFARYAQALKSLDQDFRLTLRAPDDLVGILRQWPGFDAVVPASQQVPRCDAQVAIGSLPLQVVRLGGSECAAPPPVAPQIEWAPQSKRIGLCWRGNPLHSNDKYRSIPLQALTPLLDSTHEWAWTSFQADMTTLEGVEFSRTAQMTTWEDTMREMGDLRLLITVDTAVAHLAGSLGVPVWLLLPKASDWRWGIDGERTAWYPSMRIFRQEKLGEWGPVIERVTKELDCL